MGAFRLGKLALLAILGPYTGRMQFRARPFRIMFCRIFLEQS